MYGHEALSRASYFGPIFLFKFLGPVSLFIPPYRMFDAFVQSAFARYVFFIPCFLPFINKFERFLRDALLLSNTFRFAEVVPLRLLDARL